MSPGWRGEAGPGLEVELPVQQTHPDKHKGGDALLQHQQLRQQLIGCLGDL